MVFVSHDRYFIDKLATRVFEVEDGEVHVFPGNYEDYLWRKSGKPLDLPVSVVVPVNGSVPSAEFVAEKGIRRVNPMKLQKLKDRCSALEADIASHEGEIAGLEGELGDFKSTDETLRLTQLLDDEARFAGKADGGLGAAVSRDRNGELEHPFLSPQRAKRSDIRNGKRHPKLVLVSIAEAEPAILHAVSAAIRVIRKLRLRVLHDASSGNRKQRKPRALKPFTFSCP